ncbi:hypothetical protein [Pedobacter endophyticus]|uniref:Uncharacterized protein n=1 Tax=Pedobacter endophyticus TaxID=2789740 RepID=A0A7U3SPF4_9SPHI|nr:hypothetical protein [Pedobacter endophyticus]QPH37864.1 hypothetical protein IZT61_12155 [Pedobacter endophyticus]
MTIFYLNNCYSKCDERETLSSALKDTLLEYKTLKTKYPEEVDGIVSHEIANLSFGKIYLSEIFEMLAEKEQRNYAYSIFNKYPIETFFNIEKALEDTAEYKIKLDEESHDAFYLKIAYDNKSLLFSLGISPDFRKNQLLISDSSGTSLSLNNLFGEEPNTDYIEGIILNEINSKKDNLDLLKALAQNPIVSSKFDKAFNKASSAVQVELINGFKKVLELQEKDENIPEQILKHNTEDENLTLSYLKIRDPEAMRLYFSIVDGQYYLASLEKKPTKKGKSNEQSTHIKNARSMVKQMKKLQNK